MDLADFNFSSREWFALRKWAEHQLTQAREKNDSIELTDFETATLRGEIRFAKRLLGLPDAVASRSEMLASQEGLTTGTVFDSSGY